MFFYDIIIVGDNMKFIRKEPYIFLITGKAGHGKSYLAKLIKEDLPNAIILQTSFYLKYYAEKITDWNGDESTKPRTLLQELGAELIRKKLDSPDFLVNRLAEDISVMSYYQRYFIVDDIRLESEITYLKKQFEKVITIKIERYNHNSLLTTDQQNHSTEQDFDYAFDYIINNQNDNLKDKISKLVKETLNEANDQ